MKELSSNERTNGNNNEKTRSSVKKRLEEG